MNVQEYISSGIVEAYVLGMADPEERLEFERMCDKFPDVLKARIDFEMAMEQLALQNAVAPPVSLRQQVLDAVDDSPGARVVPIIDAPSAKRGWMKYAIAASIILLAGSIYWNVSLYRGNERLERDMAGLKNNYDTAMNKLANVERNFDLIGDSSVKMAYMKGMPAAPTAAATVYWDSTSKDVYLLINNLPKPASDKQYQLWALLNGQPIDLGMVPDEYFVGQKKLLLRMKNTSGAHAFAITLEKKGGNPTPQGVMYVVGNL